MLSLLLVLACDGATDDTATPPPAPDHGPLAEDIYARLGEPVPYATDEQLDAFGRGLEVGIRRFSREDGLGPAFNLTFCLGCHEKPVLGGSSGLYRSFFLTGRRTDDGAFFPGTSAGSSGGVIRMYHYGDAYDARPEVPDDTNVFAQRNAIPFFGVGLLAGLADEEILERADPDDLDGDGISGRANYDRGFVGRFGRKSQTVSIEGFIRGPLFNHLGITTDPLTEAQKAALPIDSSTEATGRIALPDWLNPWAQAAAPDGPLEDDDGAVDPELSTDDLFDLVSYAMLLAPPEPEPLTGDARAGQILFDETGCADCHTPRLDHARGPLPVYSDLLLHDMGEALADGLEQGEATGSEFRTQPLWGIGVVGPYLHDGRASTLDDAIRLHGGEGDGARGRYERLSAGEQGQVVAFLESLGGRDQHSLGLLEPGAEVPAEGEWGGPVSGLDAEELARFEEGRVLFDREFTYAEGVGGPRFNGDSCRACHFEPVLGGAGPRGVNVMRHGLVGGDDEFVVPTVGTILHKETSLMTSGANSPQGEATIFEHRQTPHLFGLGLIEGIDESTILAAADPHDDDDDGISGKASWTDGGQLGRFGWKAQVPSVEEFVRDAVTAELGMTLPLVDGLTFGRIHDNDAVLDPEFLLEDADLLTFTLQAFGAPPRAEGVDPEAEAAGEVLFTETGCADCHTPSLEGASGPVPLYSDLLLHAVLDDGEVGIEDAGAEMTEFRTAPLWGLRATGPWLHDGAADTLAEAVLGHRGEATDSALAFEDLSAEDQAALLTFLETL